MLSQICIAMFAARCVFALPEPLVATPTTCGPTIYTTGVVVTYESIITAAHSCYSYTATKLANIGCVTYSCLAHPDCVFVKTLTTFVPGKDQCCPTTGTTTVVGPCYTCQTGCATSTVWATVTTTGGGTTTDGVGIGVTPHSTTTNPHPLTAITPVPRAIGKKDPQSFIVSPGCTTTLYRVSDWQLGPTRTAYAWTVTETATANCGGCEYIVDRALNGLGPAVSYTVTYKDPNPITATKYVCATRIVGGGL